MNIIEDNITNTIKQISIGEQLYNIDAKYWGGVNLLQNKMF